MAEKLAKWFVGVFGGLLSSSISKYIFIIILSMSPILELRGGLIAASIMNLDPWISFVICIIANIIPIPFLLLLLDKLLNFMRKHKTFHGILNKLDKKVKKNRQSIEKYGFWALLLFVAVPLPGSGGWTGALIATALKLDKKKSFATICLGILIAAIVMMLFSYGLLSNIM